MSVGYQLVNQSKKERIIFSHLPVSTRREIAGHPVSAALVSWYLLENQGDEIQFVSDTYDDWPFNSGCRDDVGSYPDRTDRLIESLIEAGLLRDDGIAWRDEDEPQTVFERDIRNIWFE